MEMRLSREDWVAAGLAALTVDGLAGVAVEPLARTLGTTKGSFYWHFPDRAALVTATLERWEQRETTEVIAHISALPTPQERLVALGAGAYASAAQGNAHAGVLAAASDPLVEPVLQRVTRTRLAFLEAQYLGIGFPGREAAHRARLAYALYLGLAEVRRADPGGEPAGDALRAYLDLAVEVMYGPRAGDTARRCRGSSDPVGRSVPLTAATCWSRPWTG
jgi:AcrR family transcriptional regulator